MASCSSTRRLPTPALRQAFEDGVTADEIFEYTKIDPWFLAQLAELYATEEWLKTQSLADLSAEDMLQIKKRGFSDSQIARAVGRDAMEVRAARKALGVVPSMKRVDTCAAEFEAATPYMYSSYDGDCECASTTSKKVRRGAGRGGGGGAGERNLPPRVRGARGHLCTRPGAPSHACPLPARLATPPRCSSWVAAPTASARASSLTTAAATPRSRCATLATRRS